MLHFKRRELHILKVLFEKAPFGVSKIAALLNISNKTVHADIKMINQQFKTSKLPICIIQNRPHGYDIECEDKHLYERLANQLQSLSSLLAVRDCENPRVPMILRAFYLADDFIKGEDFEDYFNISDTTLTSDLKEVREVCAHYGLEIESVPYRGMRLIGPEMSKRSMFIDFHDLYVCDEEPLFFIHFFDDLGLHFDDLMKRKENLNAMLHHFNFRISDASFLHVLVFLIDVLRLDKKDLASDDFIDDYFYDDAMMQYLKDVFGLETKRERAYFMHFLSLNLDLGNEHHRLVKEKNPRYQQYFGQSLHKLTLEANINFDDSMELMAYFNLFEKRLHHAKAVHYYHYRYHQQKQGLVEYLNVSNALAYLIYQDLRKHYQLQFFLDWWMDLALTIYNTAYIIPNVYEDVDIIIVNPYGRYFNESFVYRSDLDLGNVHMHYYYEHELQYLNLEEYDAILSVEKQLKDADTYPIPVMHFDYYVKQKEYRRLWNRILMTHKKEDFMEKQLEMQCVDTKPKTLQKEALPAIPAFQKRIYGESLDELKKILAFFQSDIQPAHWILFYPQAHESFLKIYQDKAKDFYLVGISLSEEILSIKQAESMIRRILREEEKGRRSE